MSSPPVANVIAESLASASNSQPDRVAIADDTDQLTFEELVALSATTAHKIIDSVESPDTILPVLVGHDPASVAALFGVIWSGQPFATLDAHSPPARLKHLLHRLADPRHALIARSEYQQRLPSDLAVIAPDHGDDPIPPQSVPPENVAMTIFTSGSTGQPKGVIHSWEILSAIWERRHDLHTSKELAPLRPLTSPLSFLAGLTRALEITLGCSLLMNNPARLRPAELLDWYDSNGFETIALVPSIAAAVSGEWTSGRKLEHVRLVTTHGEALTWEHVRSLRALLPDDTPIDCGFAASEAPGAPLRFTVTPEMTVSSGKVPLGQPATPDRVHLQPWGDDPDDPQEIIVRGRVALGYLGDPELTAQRFFVDEEGVRCWRSGDLATKNPAGDLIHHGRVDEMVKINGKLVEPAEAERVVAATTGVDQAVVLPHTSDRGRVRLVAHVVAERDAALLPSQLHSRLRNELPTHARPTVVVRHESLPLTPRGKVDRIKLRQAPLTPWRDHPPRPPVGRVERFITEQAGRILELPLDADTNLWEVGLDSLAAVELAAVIGDAGFSGVDPPSVVNHPTPASLARLVDGIAPRRTSVAVEMNPDAPRTPLFIIPGGGESAIAYRSIAEQLSEHPVVVIEAYGMHVKGRPDRTVEGMAKRALAEILPRLHEGPCVIAGHSAGGPVAYEIGQQLSDRGQSAHVVLLDAAGLGPRSSTLVSQASKVASKARSRTIPEVLRGACRLTSRTIGTGIGLLLAGRRTVRKPTDYKAFGHLAVRAVQRYRPLPATMPVTMIQPRGSQASRHWQTVAPELEVFEVGGDHRSMVEHPHSIEISPHLGSILEQSSNVDM